MRSAFSNLAIIGVTAALVASAIAPASAATRHKRTPVTAETTTQPLAAPAAPSIVPRVFQQNECVSDEGYGRYSLCDQGSL